MNSLFVREACLELGYVEPINIETTGKVWLGDDSSNPTFLTDAQQAIVESKTDEIHQAYLIAHPVPSLG